MSFGMMITSMQKQIHLEIINSSIIIVSYTHTHTTNIVYWEKVFQFFNYFQKNFSPMFPVQKHQFLNDAMTFTMFCVCEKTLIYSWNINWFGCFCQLFWIKFFFQTSTFPLVSCWSINIPSIDAICGDRWWWWWWWW